MCVKYISELLVLYITWIKLQLKTKFLQSPAGGLCGLTGRTVGHRSIAPGFKPRPGYIRKVFIFHFASLPLEVTKPS